MQVPVCWIACYCLRLEFLCDDALYEAPKTLYIEQIILQSQTLSL